MRADPTRPLSLLARSAWASLLALVAFLGVTGFALDRAYYEGTRTAERDRLQSYLYAYLAGFDMRRDGTLIPPDAPPQPDFDRPGSGLYAVISDRKVRAGPRARRAAASCPPAASCNPGKPISAARCTARRSGTCSYSARASPGTCPTARRAA